MSSADKLSNMINWEEVTDNQEVIRLIKEIERIEHQIRLLDSRALVRYELELLQHTPDHATIESN